MADLLRAEGVDRRRRGEDRRTGEEGGELRPVTPFRWVLGTFGGWSAGFVLAIILLIAVESLGMPASQSPLPLGMGLGVGYAQSRLLGYTGGGRRSWTVGTAVGLAAPFLVSDLARLIGAPLPYDLSLFVALGGVTVSVLQWALLRRVAPRAWMWLLASPLAWLLAGSTVWVSDRWLPRIPGIVGALLYIGIVLSGGILLGLCTLAGRPRGFAARCHGLERR